MKKLMQEGIKMDLNTKLLSITKKNMIEKMQLKYHNIVMSLSKGVYIWGTGRLGRFVHDQCEKNNINIYGYIDNDIENINSAKKCYSYNILTQDDVVIIASFYCVDIIKQLKALGVKNYIYYENLALILGGFATYCQSFQGIHEELEKNRGEYAHLYNVFTDDLSREIYTDIINYRISLDTKYTIDASKLSLQQGVQYFDRIILNRLNKEFIFFDVGGFDGESTLDFIKSTGEYRKVFFFEPDKDIIKRAKDRLHDKENIVYFQTGVGEKSGIVHYDAIGGGAGNISENGSEIIEMIALDDYIENNNVYVKMDIEGYELQALEGMKNAIMQYKPMLAISVYHKPGDMHKLVNKILSWNSDYQVYMRHYTNTYADTVCYFIDDGVYNKTSNS